MKFAITGGTGFVGRQVVKFLLSRGHDVRLLTRRSVLSDPDLSLLSVEVVDIGDLLEVNRKVLDKAFRGVDVLVHAAWYADPTDYLTSPKNFDSLSGTIRIATAFAEHGGARFVGIGSCAEYEMSKGRLSVDSPLVPDTLYGACKLSAYHLLRQIFARSNTSYAWCRLFYLYGAHEHEQRLVASIRRQLSVGGEVALTDGYQVRDYLDVKDAGALIARIADSRLVGPFNVCSGIGITIRELAQSIAEQFGRKDLLKFGSRARGLFDPDCVVGEPFTERMLS